MAVAGAAPTWRVPAGKLIAAHQLDNLVPSRVAAP
jgi:hypothetical protein